ncbi:MAG: ATP-binding cassette domain-containing protein [Verrucomicrobiota bacterium]
MAVPEHILLKVSGLTKSFGGQRVLHDLAISLLEGEVVLLQGDNGSGKTTLLNILTGNLEPDHGSIEYRSQAPIETCHFPRSFFAEFLPFKRFTPELVARLGLGRTWQDVRLFGSQSLRDNIAVANNAIAGEKPLSGLLSLPSVRKASDKVNRQADEILSELGLSDRGSSSADKISLGQSKRVAIARAVASGARILFLDEPLAGLDRKGIDEVLLLLETLVKQEGLTLVIVEHSFNLVHLEHLVNVRWNLSEGKITKETELTKRRLGRVSHRSVEKPGWFEFLSQKSESVESESLPRGAVLTRFRLPERFRPEPALVIENLCVKRGRRSVIGRDEAGEEVGLDLTLSHGEIVVLQAPNGWGKSTLLEALAGLIPSDAGSVQLGDLDVLSLPAWQRPRRGIHLNLAGSSSHFGRLTLREVAELSGQETVEDPSIADSRFLDSLSGGQLRRVALGNFLNRPNLRVALLDEPFLAFDNAMSVHFLSRIVNTPFETMFIAEPNRLDSESLYL